MQPATLTAYDLGRYDRQIMMFGEESQRKLKSATVVIAGVGGLGTPVSLYLAVAGVGRLRLIDNDTVDLSNLNRQVLHWDGDIGKPKVESASGKLRNINPSISIESINTTIDDSNVMELVKDADCIVDCMDNFPTRYILNRAALLRSIPFFHAAVYGMEARVSTIIPGETACLRCLYPSAPPLAKFPVLGAAPGLAAMVQVMEVVKFITGTGTLLKDRLMLFDGEVSRCEILRLRWNPDCPDCSPYRQKEEA